MNKISTPVPSEFEGLSQSDSSLEKAVMKSNQLAMQNLEQSQSNHVLFYLNQGLLSCKHMKNSEVQNRLLALTYNNLACYFQYTKNSEKALEFLFKAVNLLSVAKDFTNLSASHLNICSILASLGEHERALRHALKCVYLLRAREKFSTTLVKAYLAAGNQYKLLKQYKDAQECYESGLTISKSMSANHSLTISLQNALTQLKNSTLVKQQTSKIIQKYNSVLHKRNKSSYEEKIMKRLQFGRSLNKSVERNKVEKFFTSGKVLNTEQRARKKFDILQQRVQEKNAAVLIQSWWRGIRVRRDFESWRMDKEIKVAEERARKAAEYANDLKAKAALRHSTKKTSRPESQRTIEAVVKIQKSFRMYLLRKNNSFQQ